MKFLLRGSLVLLFGVAVTLSSAYAQTNLDVFFGVGTATDSHAAPTTVPGFVGTFTGPKLDGTFGKIGADVLLSHGLGFGGEADFRFSQAGYFPDLGLNYRPIFWDFNGIFAPGNGRIEPDLEAGIGGADIKYYVSQSSCLFGSVCSNVNQYIQSSNHFQLHFSAGVRFYVTPHIFLRPQVDAHWVHNFVDFGSDWAPEYSVSVGWSFAAHQ